MKERVLRLPVNEWWYGLIKDGKLLKTIKASTNAFDVIRQIGTGARELAQNAGISFDDVSGIAVGFPGMVIDNVVIPTTRPAKKTTAQIITKTRAKITETKTRRTLLRIQRPLFLRLQAR